MTAISNTPLRSSRRVDRFGAMTSGLCAAHCAICSLLPAALGALGMGFLLGQEAEWVFTLLAVTLATGALILGWRRHRSTKVATLLILGIAGLLTSRYLELTDAHHEHHSHGAHRETGRGTESIAHSNHSHHPERPQHSSLDDHDTSHLLGATVGIMAGMLLLTGHILNLRTNRPYSQKCTSS